MFVLKQSKINKIFSITILFLSLIIGTSYAEQHHEESELKGPHGGKLIQQGEYSVEITVVEQGIPPEMRVFVYQKNELLNPSAVDLNITLSRLGGKQDILSFAPEKDYLVSQQTVVEPHSFTVEIEANIQGKKLNWQYDNFEGRTVISDRLLALSQVETEQVKPQTLHFNDTLFGIVSPITNKVANVNAPYPGIIKAIKVNLGDSVKAGQLVAVVTNSDTLQDYKVYSVSAGEITEQFLNVGDNTQGSAIVQVTDLSSVWIDLSAFPQNIEKLSLG